MWYSSKYNQEKKPLDESWHTIVHLYSRGRLTCSSDKLVAISGIARVIQERSKDQYLAGLWRRQMEIQLCWFAYINWQARPKAYRAPSWSWASVDSACYYPETLQYATLQAHAHVLDAHVVPSGRDCFG
jgi:hypothetical protein